MQRFLALMFLGGLLCAGLKLAPPGAAMPLSQVVSTIQSSGGRYVYASASLEASDCSGLVSVAQTLATGEPVRRLGDTHTLLAGGWPHALPGAAPDDVFIIASTSSHMVAQVNGVGIESRTRGEPFIVGPAAHSVWDPAYRRYHVDPGVLVLN